MTNDVVVIEQPAGNPYAIMPVLDIHGAMTRRQAVIDYTRALMVSGVDYGKIPGTGDKPTLLKPGAEKLASLFGLSPRFEIIEREMDWTGQQHGGEPFFYMQYRCTLTRGDLVAGQGVGSCNSWEKKYRWRNVYPEKATAEDKEHGRLETRTGKNGKPYNVYVVKNGDPADVVNTIDKMAQKRALVAAVLIAVNASELFTQDVEDYSDIVDGDWTPAPAVKQAAPPAPARPAANGKPPTAPPVQPAADPGPLADDELTINEAPAAQFFAMAASLLETDEVTVKIRFAALGYTTVPGHSYKRVDAYRALKRDMDEAYRRSDELHPNDPKQPKPTAAAQDDLFSDDPTREAALATAQGRND